MSSNVTFDEMNELLDEINRSGGETWVDIDGQTYYTDWGYGVVAILFFIRMLKNRKSDIDATAARHDVVEDARSLIDGEVHRDCEYYVYSQLRDCIDVIDDDYEQLKAENAKLREELEQWHRLSAGIELPEYPVTEFHPKNLERENAKLRELAQRMFDVISSRNSWWDGTCKDTEHFACLMRDLGIEVDE